MEVASFAAYSRERHRLCSAQATRGRNVRVAKQQNYPLPGPHGQCYCFADDFNGDYATTDPGRRALSSFPLPFSHGPCYSVFIMEPLDNFLNLEIKPRPLETPILPAPEPIAPPVQPSPPLPTSIRGPLERDGPTQGEILLQAIVLEARKEQTPVTTAAMRTLIAKFTRECGLGF